MATEILTYEADGLSMKSYLYTGDGAPPGARRAILVFPEAFGLSAHAKSRAEKLAAMGYVALACDLHGDERLHEGLDQIMPIITELRANPLRIRARAEAALAVLAARPEVDATRIAAIGYCFGGTMALELARSGAAIRSAIGFHSGLATIRPEDARNIKGKVLVCIGADDPGISPEERAAFEQEMRGGGVDWQLHLYGGVVHSFTNPDADQRGMPEFLRYDATADARSWAAMHAHLDEVLA